jgi:hypothetical protein
MALLLAITALLWILVSALVFAIGVVVFYSGNRLSTAESMISAVVLVLLAAPIALQIRALAARRREYRSNVLELGGDSIKVRLEGTYRAAKGLPPVQETRVPWFEVMEVTKARRNFIYRSLIPFRYPLSVYTIATGEGEISFTRERVIGAKRTAEEIAARLGQDI